MDVELQSMSEAETATTRPRILIVNDDEVDLKMRKMLLEYEGMEVEFSANPNEGMMWVEEKVYDLIIADYRMTGDMDGIQFIKQAEEKVHTRMVLMSADPDLQRKAIHADVRYFVSKNLLPQDFVEEIKKLLVHR